MMKKILIRGIDVPIFYVDNKILCEVVNSDISNEDEHYKHLAGCYDEKNIEIYINQDMHPFEIQKTLVHESIHALHFLYNEMVSYVNHNNAELISYFISNNPKDIYNILHQIYGKEFKGW